MKGGLKDNYTFPIKIVLYQTFVWDAHIKEIKKEPVDLFMLKYVTCCATFQ